MFARYAGMNMSPIPAGYMESVAQEANMYASMGANIANMLMKDSEMKLKEKEIDATNKTAFATAGKNANEARKLELQEARDAADRLSKTESEGRLAVTSAITSLRERMSPIDSEIKAYNQAVAEGKAPPFTKQEYDEKVRTFSGFGATLDRLVKEQASMAERLLNQSKPSTSSYPPLFGIPINSTTTYPNNPNVFGGLNSMQTIDTIGGPVRRNPNEASKPANGGSEANGGRKTSQNVSGDELRMAGIPVAVKAFSGEAPPPNAPAGTETVGPAETPSKLEFTSLLNLPLTLDRGVKDFNNVDVNYTFKPKADGGIELIANSDMFDIHQGMPVLKKDSAIAGTAGEKAMLEDLRRGHLMFWAMRNSDLLGKISPTAQEIRDAKSRFITKENAKIADKIYKAYAYVNRDRSETSAPQGWAVGAMDVQFVNDHQMSTNDWVILGDVVQKDNTAFLAETSAGLEERLASAYAKRAEVVRQLSEATSPIINPHAADIDRMQKEIDFLTKTLPSDLSTEFAKGQLAKIRALGDNLENKKRVFDAWNEGPTGPKQMAERAAALSARLKEESDTLAQLTEVSRLGESRRQQISAISGEFQRWIGTGTNDKQVYKGWVAEGVYNFPGYPVTINGRKQTLSAAEYQRWALSDALRASSVAGIMGRMRLPTVKTLTEDVAGSVFKVNESMDGLGGSLVELFGRFKKLNEMSIAGSLTAKFRDEQINAAEPLRSGLIASIRTAFIGGGNPSNFEQEILMKNVPDPAEIFSLSERGLARIKLLTMAVIMAHAKTMERNNMRMTEDSLDYYNQTFGKVLGKKLTMEDFAAFKGVFDRVNRVYEGTLGANPQIRQEFLTRESQMGISELTNLVDARLK
jgi:hypothetical protein